MENEVIHLKATIFDMQQALGAADARFQDFANLVAQATKSKAQNVEELVKELQEKLKDEQPGEEVHPAD